MPITPVARTASTGLSLALPLLTSLSNPVSAAIAGGVGLVALVDRIGQGRKAANKFTQNGGPQDIVNQQLKAIAASGASAQEKAQATEKAWTDFLGAANQFAAANPKQSKVVQQAIYQTPDLTNTVKSLMGGKDPLDPSFTQAAAQGIATGAAGKNPGPSIGGTLLQSGLAAATPFLVGALNGGGSSTSGGGIDTSGGISQTAKEAGLGSSGGGVGGFLNSLFGGNSKSILPTLLSAGSTALGGVLAARAAQNSGQTQADAVSQASQLQNDAASKSLDFSKQIYSDQQAANKPFLEAGTNALSEVQKLLGPGGDLSKDFAAPTAEEVRQTPGYQLDLSEAMKALERSTRGVTSGATIKAADRFATDYADTKYGAATDRALNIFQTNRANRLNPLLTVAGFGPNAVNANNTAGTNAAATNTNVNTNLADSVGSLDLAGAGAKASAGVDSTNALVRALAQMSSLAQNRQLLTRSSQG